MISIAVSINLILFGLTGPFAAALMDRFGRRAVTVGALVTVATGALLTTVMIVAAAGLLAPARRHHPEAVVIAAAIACAALLASLPPPA